MAWLSDAQFVTAYIACKNVQEMAKKTGLSLQAIQARAMRLRKQGVKLPRYSRKKVFDLAELNAIIDAYMAKTKPIKKPKK